MSADEDEEEPYRDEEGLLACSRQADTFLRHERNRCSASLWVDGRHFAVQFAVCSEAFFVL